MSLKPPVAGTTPTPSFLDTLPFGGFVNVLEHGATGDGTTDDLTAFRNAYASGDPIYVPEGRYRLTAQFTSAINAGGTTPLILVGDGPGKTVLIQDADARIVNLGEALGSSVSITVTANAGATSLTVTSTSGLSAGDWIQVSSSATHPGTTKSAVVGELARIKSVDSATGLTLRGPLEESYATGDTPIIKRAPMIDGCLIRDLTFENENQGTYTGQLEVIRLNQVANARVENVDFKYLDNAAMKIATCVDWVVDRCRFLDSTNDDGNNRFGYGVSCFNASRNGTVSNCFMNRGRHLFTTGGTASTPVPKHVTVIGCHGTNMDSTVFDTHEEGKWITFSDCTATNCTSNAFSARAPKTRFLNCVSVATDRAVIIAATGDQSQVIGGSFTGVNRITTTQAHAIDVEADECSVIGAYIEDIEDEAIHVAGNDCTISGVVIKTTAKEGVEVTGARAHIGGGTRITTATTGVLLNGSADSVVDDVYVESVTTGVSVNSTCTNARVGEIHTRSVTTAVSLNSSATYASSPSLSGAGSPEGNVSAPPGSIWRRTNGSEGSSVYLKQSGSSNTGWVPVQVQLSGTATWDPGSIADDAMTSTTVTVTGADVGDPVAVGFSTAVPAGALLVGSVTAADTVTVTLHNNTGSPLDLASGTLRATVWDY